MRLRRNDGVIPAVAFLAILPLLLRGPSCGHDFDFHLLSWLEAANQLARGGYPHWAYTPAYNAGEPRFLFYPPLSWLLGAVLGFVLPWTLVATAFTCVALTASGLAARRFVRAYVGENVATLVGVLYLANPYMLFTAYERTAYGELLAAAFVPLLFAAALAPRVRASAVAIPVALLWLSNAPAAVMGCYALAVLTLVRLLTGLWARNKTSGRLAVAVAGGTALGLALPAFFLLPAAYERPWIESEMAVVEGMRIADNTLFHHMLPVTDDTLFHDQVLHSASLIAIGLLLVITAAGAVLAWRRDPKSSAIMPLYGLAAVLTFLLTPLSVAVWAHVPQLAFLQFPWRLCALLAPIAVLQLARLLPVLSWRATLLGSTGVAALLIVPAYTLFQQRCYPEDSVPVRVALFHSAQGTEGTDEYTPSGTDADALHPHDPPYWTVCRSAVPAGEAANLSAPADLPPGPTPDHFSVSLPCPSYLVLNRRQYPAWQLEINGSRVEPYAEERNDGLITAVLPAGPSTVDLRFRRTRDRTLGWLVSAAAALCLLLLRRRRSPV